MRLIDDLQPGSPAHGVALDDVLLEGVKHGGRDVLRFWTNQRGVVIGRSQKLNDEVDLTAARRLGFPVVRRISGGGSVLHYPGNLNVSVIVSDARRLGTVEEAFERVGLSLARGVNRLQIESRVEGSALFAGAAKISGAAQARRGHAALYHATILVGACPVQMEEILLAMRSGYAPSGVPSRPHEVTTLEDLLGRPVELGSVVAGVCAELAVGLRVDPEASVISEQERIGAQDLVLSRYGRWSWTASR